MTQLTVSDVGTLGSGDSDSDGGLHAIAGPAHILARICRGCLEDVQAGASNLGSSEQNGKWGTSQNPTDALSLVFSAGNASPSVQKPRLIYASVYLSICLTVSIGFGSGWSLPTLLPPHTYLVPGRETASTPVPCDLGMGLPSHNTVEVQGVPLSHSRGGGLNSNRCGGSGGCKQKDRAGTCSYSPENGISTTLPLLSPVC